jgi:hypothetical protein
LREKEMGDFLAREETLHAICSTDVAIEAFQQVIAQIESSNRCVYAMTIREIVGRRGDCTRRDYPSRRRDRRYQRRPGDRRCWTPVSTFGGLVAAEHKGPCGVAAGGVDDR